MLDRTLESLMVFVAALVFMNLISATQSHVSYTTRAIHCLSKILEEAQNALEIP